MIALLFLWSSLDCERQQRQTAFLVPAINPWAALDDALAVFAEATMVACETEITGGLRISRISRSLLWMLLISITTIWRQSANSSAAHHRRGEGNSCGRGLAINASWQIWRSAK